MSGVQKTGDWARARALLAASPQKMKLAVTQALSQEAQGLRKEIVQGLTQQAPGGEALKPLSPLTIAAREMKGFGGTKALMVRADLRNAIAAIVRGDTAFVGVPRKARDKNGRPTIDIAQLNEFGSDPIVIPMTRAMRRYLFALFARAGVSRKQGTGRGVVVVRIPARPFLRPAFRRFSRGAQRRVLTRIAKQLGYGRSVG